MDNNQFDAQSDIARFLEKFNQEVSISDFSFTPAAVHEGKKAPSAAKQEQYNQSFERLEEKIRELEEKFEASAAQNEAVMRELARTREAVENQKSKDAFFANISTTIANLKESVENLSRAQQNARLYDPAPAPNRGFDVASGGEYTAMSYYQPDSYRAAQQAKLAAERTEKEKAVSLLKQVQENNERAQADLTAERSAKEQVVAELATARQQKEQALSALQTERLSKEQAENELKGARQEKEKLLSNWQAERLFKEQAIHKLTGISQEKEQALTDLQNERSAKTLIEAQLSGEREEKARIISSLQQKASQLKAVNVALDREIKRTQQERMEALHKSAEQAKEILSLRSALTAAEERFKSFDFEGRIISIKRQYQQKVTTLENQLHEISKTCMKQVEEIESLKAENLKLHKIAEEREQLAALYEAKTRELEEMQSSVAQLRAEKDNTNQSRLAAFTVRMQNLQKEHESLSARLTQAQEALQNVSAEKQTLENNFKTLMAKIEQNDTVIKNLKRKIDVLTAENKELKDRADAPKTEVRRVMDPKEPVTVRQPLPNKQPAKATQATSKTLRTALPQTQEAPVEMQNTLRSKVQTEADLPEIRVADPMPQEELYNGEDFLEKTDSFIGRMKWSIFREDK